MKSDFRLELKKQCEIVIDELKTYYESELRYNGVIKDIHDKFITIIEKIEDGESVQNDSFSGCVRMFVDDTTDYTSPIIKNIEKAENLLERCQS
ncbi:hypothetical protein CWR48_16345 [Oceanobacillus arenosus]|uniref:Uncharacterized protein n=1 Tax=Oceanobacillus arenosus TaxID=1229153 RepID=A0A3D8PK45_9BACI|nr:hypothetical protein [Oceanobacillus arenosus]RDW16453.1 hypothetical protein CWR48_16345 [Oceanobacillus arenosus]